VYHHAWQFSIASRSLHVWARSVPTNKRFSTIKRFRRHSSSLGDQHSPAEHVSHHIPKHGSGTNLAWRLHVLGRTRTLSCNPPDLPIVREFPADLIMVDGCPADLRGRGACRAAIVLRPCWKIRNATPELVTSPLCGATVDCQRWSRNRGRGGCGAAGNGHG
jgi:hypothetical protein